MFRWAVAAVGIVAAMIAIFIGVVLFLFSRDGPDVSDLTELHSAEVLDLTDLGSSYRVVYEYTYEGQTFYGRKTINGNSLHRGSTFGICLDPSDPAKHAHTHTDCGPGGPLDPQEGLKEKPDL